MGLRFFKCLGCNKVVEEIISSGCTPVCCGKEMFELKANTTDAATEKHIPVVEINGNTITATIGSVIHPMETDHYIQFIGVETDKGFYKKYLNPGDSPKATFTLTNEKFIAAYELCNKHGLWKK